MICPLYRELEKTGHDTTPLETFCDIIVGIPRILKACHLTEATSSMISTDPFILLHKQALDRALII